MLFLLMCDLTITTVIFKGANMYIFLSVLVWISNIVNINYCNLDKQKIFEVIYKLSEYKAVLRLKILRMVVQRIHSRQFLNDLRGGCMPWFTWHPPCAKRKETAAEIHMFTAPWSPGVKHASLYSWSVSLVTKLSLPCVAY